MKVFILLITAAVIVSAVVPCSAGGSNITSVSAAKKKPAVSKAKKKRKPDPKASEYKFSGSETTPSYRFDKFGNPITKKMELQSANSGKSTGHKQAKGQEGKIPKMTAPAAKKRYVCPMGDYEGDKPGICPKCGMTLVEKSS